MSLIICPECKREISSFAAACPGCGYPIAAKTEKTSEDVKEEFSNPLEFWEGQLKECELVEYGNIPSKGYVFYSYEDLLKRIGLRKSIAFSRHLEIMPYENFVKLPPIFRSIGFQIKDQYVEKYEELIEKQAELLKDQKKSEDNADLIIFEKKYYDSSKENHQSYGLDIKLSINDLIYYGKKEITIPAYSIEKYREEKSFLEAVCLK